MFYPCPISYQNIRAMSSGISQLIPNTAPLPNATTKKAECFAEIQLLALDDADYVAEGGGVVCGWWGPCCVECLRRVQETPELIWLSAQQTSSAALQLSQTPALLPRPHFTKTSHEIEAR
jgi:hypothetical protein